MHRNISHGVGMIDLGSSCLAFHRGPMPGEPRDARFIDLDGVRVRFTDTGGDSQRVVVLVHGFASALEIWAPVLPALRSYRVVTLDLKGFGWTDRPKGDYSPAAQAKLLLDLLDRLGVAQAALVGHSWGSSVVLSAALLAPARVTRLALYDAWVYEDQLPAFFHWARAEGVGEMMFGLYYKQRAEDRLELAFFDKAHVTDQRVADVYASFERPGTVAAALAAVRGQRFSAIEPQYRTIQKPTLLLWGREDRVAPLPFGERLARELPIAELAVYPSCGHFPMIEAPLASNRDLVAFLDATPPT